MTDKTMPERIYAMQPPTSILRTWMESDSRGGVEYIRDDLVPKPARPDEPLAHGQWRWVRVNDEDAWEAALVPNGHEIRVASTSEVLSAQRFAEIGPVIQPPDSQTS